MAQGLSCRNHVERRATYECRSCFVQVCNDCTKHVWQNGGFVEDCPKCDARLFEVLSIGGEGEEEDRAPAPDEGAQAYLERIPSFLLYVVSKPILLASVALALANAAIFWFLFDPSSLLISLFALMVTSALNLTAYFHIISQTAQGRTDLDTESLLADTVGALARYLVAWSPILLAMAWFGEVKYNSVLAGIIVASAEPKLIFDMAGPGALYALGFLLLPLLTIIAAISRSVVEILSPAIWVDSLRIMGTSYLFGAAAFYGVYALEVFYWVPKAFEISASIFDSNLFLLLSMSFALSFFPLALRGRVLGGLCEPFLSGD